jgi:hypothetical protein
MGCLAEVAQEPVCIRLSGFSNTTRQAALALIGPYGSKALLPFDERSVNRECQ